MEMTKWISFQSSLRLFFCSEIAALYSTFFYKFLTRVSLLAYNL